MPTCWSTTVERTFVNVKIVEDGSAYRRRSHSECCPALRGDGAKMRWADVTDGEENDLALALKSPVLRSPSSASITTIAPESEPSDESHAGEGSTRGCNRAQHRSHVEVPKNVNLAQVSVEQTPEEVTTLMMKRLPKHLCQKALVKALNRQGLEGKFDFLYIPVDLSTSCNVGYGFVNFIDEESATRCRELFHEKPLKENGRPLEVTQAHLQGLEANLKHYEKSAVSTSRLRQRRPIVLTPQQK